MLVAIWVAVVLFLATWAFALALVVATIWDRWTKGRWWWLRE